MEISQIIPHVEALIFAADRPLPAMDIVELLNNALAFLEDRATLDQVETALDAIREKYNSEFYAFEIRSSGGGYQFLTKKEYYQTVAQLNGDKFLKRLSTAALETLAIIAYRQPISKGEIEHIRGVSTDYSIQKLLEKELIVISGRSEDLPGKPLLYATSKSFMDYFGLNSPADLPKLKELFDEESIQPTLINDDTATIGRYEGVNGAALVVSEDGELVERDETVHLPPVHPEDVKSHYGEEEEEQVDIAYPDNAAYVPPVEEEDIDTVVYDEHALMSTPASESPEAEPDDEQPAATLDEAEEEGFDDPAQLFLPASESPVAEPDDVMEEEAVINEAEEEDDDDSDEAEEADEEEDDEDEKEEDDEDDEDNEDEEEDDDDEDEEDDEEEDDDDDEEDEDDDNDEEKEDEENEDNKTK